MSIIVERDELAKALAFVTRSAAKKDSIPILNHLLVKPNGAMFSITATNMDMQSECNVAAEIKYKKPFTAPAADLLALVNRLPVGSHVTLDPSDVQIAVKAGRSSYKLRTLCSDDFPNPFAVKGEVAFEIPGKDLARSLEAVQFASSEELSRVYLMGVCIGVSASDHPVLAHDRRLYLCATDGHILGYTTLDIAPEIPQVIIPSSAVLEIIRLAKDDEIVTLGISERLVRLVHSGGTFTSKLVDGTFPEFYRVIPADNKRKVIFDVEELTAALERLEQIDNRIRADFTEGKVALSVVNPDKGEAHEEIECEWDGAAMSIGFVGSQIISILAAIQTECVAMFLHDHSSPIVLRPHQEKVENNVIYVEMPIRA